MNTFSQAISPSSRSLLSAGLIGAAIFASMTHPSIALASPPDTHHATELLELETDSEEFDATKMEAETKMEVGTSALPDFSPPLRPKLTKWQTRQVIQSHPALRSRWNHSNAMIGIGITLMVTHIPLIPASIFASDWGYGFIAMNVAAGGMLVAGSALLFAGVNKRLRLESKVLRTFSRVSPMRLRHGGGVSYTLRF